MVEKAVVEEWLQQQDLELVEVELAESELHKYAWCLSFKSAPYRTIVAHPDVTWNRLLMQVDVGIAERHRELLLEVDEEVLERFGYDLRVKLLESRVAHAFAAEERGDLRTLSQITIYLNVLDDPLTKAIFFRRNMQIQSAAQLAALMFQRLNRFKDR